MRRREFFEKLALNSAGLAALGGLTGCATSSSAVRESAKRRVLNGIDVLVKQNFAPLRNLRLGLITNHTGQDRHRRSTIDLLKEAGVQLAALFSPEHGIRGELDSKISDSVDQKTGLPVHSLYGERRSPTPEQLHELDALAFDIQDIGCRFYTYPSTMGFCLEAAAKAKLKFLIFDRINPINGVALEGPTIPDKHSFTAFYRVPLRHGMTVGELAQMYNVEKDLGADLTVIRAEDWRRESWFDESVLPWTNPSPNMRSLSAATLYPGLGLHESALSVGRGTDKPFEMIGAPYIDDVRVAEELNGAALPGVRCVPVQFTPSYSTFKDKPCGGAAFIITDRDKLNAVDLGITVALVLQRLYPNEFALEKVNTLLQHKLTIDAIKAGRTLDEIKNGWTEDLREFKQRRQPFLLYG